MFTASFVPNYRCGTAPEWPLNETSPGSLLSPPVKEGTTDWSKILLPFVAVNRERGVNELVEQHERSGYGNTKNQAPVGIGSVGRQAGACVLTIAAGFSAESGEGDRACY